MNPDGVPRGVDVPPAKLPSPNSARNIVILGIVVIVVGVGVVVAFLGNLTGMLAGACCGLGGAFLIALALLGQRALRQRPVPGVSPPTAMAEEQYVCGKCGADLAPGAKFCGKCGEPVEE